MLLTHFEALGLLPAKAETFQCWALVRRQMYLDKDIEIWDYQEKGRYPLPNVVHTIGLYSPKLVKIEVDSFKSEGFLLPKRVTGWHVKLGNTFFIRIDQRKANKLFAVRQA